MIKIALVDDQDYSISQIITSISHNILFDFYHFESYKQALGKHFDIILLDYHLDKDKVKWKDIIDQLSWDIIIWFSSAPSCNDLLLRHWAIFAVDKVESDVNNDLKNLFSSILKKKK